jgi:signal transduction histidine kinase
MAEVPTRFSRARAERTIAATRVGIAAFSLYAIWLDPAEPARFTQVAYFLHIGYLAYSAALAAVMWTRTSAGWLPITTHVIDIVFFSVLQYLTLGPSSPFFTYFIFSLFCGAVRWGWQGVLATAPAVVIAFVTMAASMSLTFGSSEFELNRFIIRGGYLIVVSVLLVYLGRHEARLREEIRRLAGWPATSGNDATVEIGRVVAHAARIVEARRAAVVWELEEEPRVQLAVWTPASFELTQHASSDLEPWVANGLADRAFVCTRESGGRATVSTDRASARTWIGDPVHPRLRGLSGETTIASAPFRTERVSGRAFFGALGAEPIEALALVDVVAREIGASIDKCDMYERAHQVAIGEDRIRVARDLHDGVLQSLTGIRLELQSLASHIATEPVHDVRDRLLTMERALATEQRELRFFIEDLQPVRAQARSGGNLGVRLEELTRQIAARWKTPVTLRLAGLPPALPSEVQDAVPRMVHEAVVNALKHGRPSRVSVSVRGRDDGLSVVVADDGHGFPFEGRFDHAALVRQNLGPASLCERVASLGGDVSVDSSASGSKVEIRLPAATHA